MLSLDNGFLDLFAILPTLSEEENAVRLSTHRYCQERLMPIVRQCHREERFPAELPRELGEMGLLGMTVQGFGGAGLNYVSYGLANLELERVDSGFRSFVSVQSSLVIYPILTFGSPSQQQRWLPELIAGRAIGCFGLTEPDFGSDPGGMLTTARRDGSDWVLNGSKMWITNGSLADVAVVWAKTDQGIRGFLVEKGTKGFTTRTMDGKWSFRASVTSELYFDECRIPAENLLPKTEGLKSALMCLSQARYGIAWGALGAAMACLEEGLKYADSRIIHGKPLSAYQIPQMKLSNTAIEITKGLLMVYRLGRLKDEGASHYTQISICKQNNAMLALQAARTMRDLLGANGIIDEYCIGRHLTNLETVITYEGTNDIHLLIVGRHLTGQNAID